MSQQVVEQFKAWVGDQPPAQTINHTTWDSCALGDYVRAVEPITDHQPIDAWELSGMFRGVYGHHNYMTLGNGGRNPHNPVAVPMATYGELSKWLNSLETVSEAKFLDSHEPKSFI